MIEPGTRIEKYEVLHEMGHGGMARVYKVRHVLAGSIHALKVLDPTLAVDPHIRRRFLDEGRIQAQLRHPNLAAVTDILAQPGIAGLLMDYADGTALDDFIDRMTAAPMIKTVKDVFIPLLSALEYVHGEGIVHRDIKPDNVVLTRDHTGKLCPKLLDFGIAKILDDESAGRAQTKTGARMGTVGYMSPEQVRDSAHVDARSDIFSVAATLYEFVARRAPFSAATDFDTMKKIVEEDPPPLRSLVPDIDPAIEECVAIGLAKSPRDRFSTCAAFAAALTAAGSPTAATPGEKERAAPLVSAAAPRRPRPLLVAAFIFAAAAAGIAASVVQTTSVPPQIGPPSPHAGGQVTAAPVPGAQSPVGAPAAPNPAAAAKPAPQNAPSAGTPAAPTPPPQAAALAAPTPPPQAAAPVATSAAQAKLQNAPSPVPKSAPKPKPQRTYAEWLALGRARREAGDPKGGVAAFQEAQALRDTLEVRLGKGWCYHDLKRASAAETEFRAAIAHDARSAEAHYGLGESLEAQKKYTAANAMYREVIKLDTTGRWRRSAEISSVGMQILPLLNSNQ